MKRILCRAPLLFLFFFSTIAYAQNLTGIWRGYFIAENGDQYKFELQLDQNGNRVSGVSYSYLSTVFYGKAELTGNFNRAEKKALITEIKTLEVRMSSFSVACIMNCEFQYAESGREQFLEGTFTSKFEKNGLGGKRGDDCGSGQVYLRKVTTSDFYIEPFLRSKLRADSIKAANKDAAPIKPKVNNFTNKIGQGVTKKTTTPKKTIPPSRSSVAKTSPKLLQGVHKKPVAKNTPPPAANQKADNNSKVIIKKDKPKDEIAQTVIPERPIRDSVIKIEEPKLKETFQKPSITIPEVLKTRENALVKTLVVKSPEITIKLYDNGVVDGDTISVYVDKKLVLQNKGLSEKPIIFELKMEQDDDEHEVTMVAENLGSIPPNTSLMIVESGDQRFNVFISSSIQKNAVVRFRYQKPKGN